MSERVVLVTGGASGIGRAVVARFAAAGDRALAADLPSAAGAGLALDVTSEAAWREALARIAADHGRLDVLVNCAGVSSGGALESLELTELRRVMAVNFEGPFLGIRAATPFLRAARGCVINVASASGRKATAGAGAYCASKAALLMLSRVAALELAPSGVRVNCVLPGGIKTPLWDGMEFFADLAREHGGREQAFAALAQDTPLARFAEPEEVAELVFALAGPAGTFVTGAEITADGGYTAG